MSEISIFEVLGPVMIGPSSSHTAGAVKLAKTAADICGREFDSVVFTLHGSFAETGRGHGTDKALVAGILGKHPDDESIKNSFEEAKEKGICVVFRTEDLGGERGVYYENTARIDFYLDGEKQTSITGSSVGGGAIVITRIDDFDVSISGEYPTLVISQADVKGVISNITRILAGSSLNIAIMRVSRSQKGSVASTVIELDDLINETVAHDLMKLPNILSVRIINPKEWNVRGAV